jgi:hypothetical protein
MCPAFQRNEIETPTCGNLIANSGSQKISKGWTVDKPTLVMEESNASALYAGSVLLYSSLSDIG